MYKKINRNSFAQFMRTRVRMLHVSAKIGTMPVHGEDGGILYRKAVVMKPGTTYNVGRNERKRRARLAAFG